MCSSKFHKIPKKTYLIQSPFLIMSQALGQQLYQKETLVQMFSCEFCEIFKNTFSRRTPLVVASELCLHFITVASSSIELIETIAYKCS